MFGTATAVGRKYLVTDFHVLDDLLKHGNDIKDIYLVQEDNSLTLTVSQLLTVSANYDMVLFEINENVEDYLVFSNEPLSDSGESLLAIGYVYSSLMEVAQVEDIIYYKDILSYGFSTVMPQGIESFHGASGGPVLDRNVEVVGIIRSNSGNMILATKAEHFLRLIHRAEGLVCSQVRSPGQCLREEKEFARLAARRGNVLALYLMGLEEESNYINKTSEDWNQSVDSLRLAAEGGFPPALYEYGALEGYGWRGVQKNPQAAFRRFKEAAGKGFPFAQKTLAIMLYHGYGVEENIEEAAYWARQAISRGELGSEELLKQMQE